MPYYLNPRKPTTPGYLQIFGHSFMDAQFSLGDTGYRMDNVLCGMMNISLHEMVNRCITGGTLLSDGGHQGSWVVALTGIKRVTVGAPYVGTGGNYLFCWGINDIGGYVPSSDYPAGTILAQVRTAFQHAYRAVISRARSAVVFECGGGDTETNWAFGAGFASTATTGFNSGKGVRLANSTTNANATFTIPADFPGGTIAFGFTGAAGAFGGTATVGGTFSGTGAASIITSSMMPAGANHGHYCRRFTNLPASDAGKTIIFTVTALDASGSFLIDYAQIEATYNIPLVVCCDIPRALNTAAYAGYAGSYWANGSNNGTTGDTDVNNWTTTIRGVAAEFDANVQVAALDAALNKSAANYGTDGIHPNPVGQELCAQAIYNTITNASVGAVNLVPDYRASMGRRTPRQSQYWYGPHVTQATTSTVAMVTGNEYVLPFLVSETAEVWDNIAFEMTAASTGTGGTVRIGMYDDALWLGYPQNLMVDWGTTVTTALGVKAVAGVAQTTRPGLYWLVFHVEAQGGTIAGTLRGFTGNAPMMPQSTSGTLPTIGTWVGNTCYTRTGVAAGGLVSQYPAGATVSAAACPWLFIRRI